MNQKRLLLLVKTNTPVKDNENILADTQEIQGKPSYQPFPHTYHSIMRNYTAVVYG